jgi:hypothetical protein
MLTPLIKIFVPVAFFGCFQPVKAQTYQVDTVGIIEKIIEKPDTMIRYSVPASPVRKWTLLQEKPIDSLLFGKNNSRFSKELFNLLFKNEPGDSVKQRSPITNFNLAAMDGKIIRRIEFGKVDIFAPSIADTTFEPSSWFEKTVNNTHYDTRRKLLKRYLLLKPGDPLDVFIAADNERLLRELSFIMDARFVARHIPESPDSVDLILYTQDMLPVGLAVDMIKSTFAELSISHYNLLGFGHQFMATLYWNAKNTPHTGFRFSYGIENLAGTFATGKLEYTHRWDQESYKVSISKDIRATSFKNAGGIMFENTFMRKNIELLDTTLYDVNLKYTYTDLWAGHLFQLRNHTSLMSSGFFLAGRINRYENTVGPKPANDYLYMLQDKSLLLFSTGFTHQGFRKDNLIYTFGRTEDVPFGFIFDFTSGVEWWQYKTRPYLSAGAAYGNYFRNVGYLYGQVKFGTFLQNSLIEQGALKLQLRYFSNIYPYNRFKLRNFVSLTYLRGINRFEGEFTDIENKGGIPGLTSQSLRGKDKLVLNLESVIFSPFKLLGFRFAFFGSIDLGLVTSENTGIFDSRLFSGLGAGVRIRNDQLIFDTFVIRFAIYPGKPANGTAQGFIIDSMPRSRFDDFFPLKPAIVPYQ